MLPQPRKLNPTMMAAAFQGRTVGLILFILLLKKVVVVVVISCVKMMRVRV